MLLAYILNFPHEEGLSAAQQTKTVKLPVSSLKFIKGACELLTVFTLRKTNMGLNSISYLGPSLWNKLPENIKHSSSLITFKHKVKEYFLKNLQKLY